MENLVQTNNLTKQYGKHKAVNNVNLTVGRGEIYGLIGRNGAGKSGYKGLTFLMTEIMLSCLIMSKKDIK